MSKQLTFYAPFHAVQVLCNGVPLSLNAEVEVTLKRPTKLDPMSSIAWNQLTQESAAGASVAMVPAGAVK